MTSGIPFRNGVGDAYRWNEEHDGVNEQLAEISRKLVGQLDSDGEFDDESTIWLPDDEDVSEDALKQLMVSNRGMPVVEGTIQLAAMAALLREGVSEFLCNLREQAGRNE